MSARRDHLREEIRFQTLRLLQDHPQFSQRDLARALGVSSNGVYYALYSLVDKEFVKISAFKASPDERRYKYVLAPKNLAEKATLTMSFLRRKLQEREVVLAEIETFQAELNICRAQDWCNTKRLVRAGPRKIVP